MHIATPTFNDKITDKPDFSGWLQLSKLRLDSRLKFAAYQSTQYPHLASVKVSNNKDWRFNLHRVRKKKVPLYFCL